MRFSLLAAILLSLPASVDNSLNKWFPPVINQVGGSCAQASYIGYMFTYEVNRMLDRDGSLPQNRFSYLYTWNFINGGEDQGSFGLDGIQLALTNGIMPEHLFPSQTGVWAYRWASGFENYLEAIKYRAQRIETVDVTSPDGIENAKAYLASGGLMTFSGYSSGWTIRRVDAEYKSIITSLPSSGSHAMTIVGYDDTVEVTLEDGTAATGAFIVCNTWGTGWGDNGRVYYPYHFFLSDRAGSVLSHDMVKVEVEVKDPSVVFRVGVECDSRNDLAFKMGVADGPAKNAPLHDYSAGIAHYAGGDYPMQGNGQSSTIEFAFDFSAALDRVEEMAEPKFFLTVQRNRRGDKAATLCRLTRLDIYDYRSSPPTVYSFPVEAPIELDTGDNIFGVATTQVRTTSYSPVKWLNAKGQPVSAPFVFRAADGRHYKAVLSGYDRSSGSINIKYQLL